MTAALPQSACRSLPCYKSKPTSEHKTGALILQMQAVTDIDDRTLKWHQQLQGRWYYKFSPLR